MSDYLDRVENDKYILDIHQDLNADSPREWDNLGTMYCFSHGYNLGDDHAFETPEELFLSLLEHALDGGEAAQECWVNIHEQVVTAHHYNTSKEFRQAIRAAMLQEIEKYYVLLPLYLMDHSGLSMSTGDYGDPWDSGQVGWIVCSFDDIKKEYGDFSFETINKARNVMRDEVRTYSQWLEGDVYGFMLYEKIQATGTNGKVYTVEDEVDSCWGYFGYDCLCNELKAELPADAQDLVSEL